MRFREKIDHISFRRTAGVTMIELIVAIAISAIGGTLMFRVFSTMNEANEKLRSVVEARQENLVITDLIRSRFYSRAAVAGFALRDASGPVFRTLDIDQDLGGGNVRQLLVTSSCIDKPRSPGFTGCGLTCAAGKVPVTYMTMESTTTPAKTLRFPQVKTVDGSAICFTQTTEFVSVKIITFTFDEKNPAKYVKVPFDWPMPKDVFVRGNFDLAP